jgi:peroxiredoxin
METGNGTGNQKTESEMRIAIILTFWALALSFAAAGKTQKLSSLPPPLQGSVIPAFNVLAIDNETEFTREDLKKAAQKSGAKRIVLAFFASWCVENCAPEFVLLKKSKKELDKNGVLVYLIDVGESAYAKGADVKNFVDTYAGGLFPFYFDPHGALLKDFGLIERKQTQYGLPITIVLDANFKVLGVFQKVGKDFPQVLWSDL